MNVFKNEFKQNFKTLLSWTFAIIAIGVVFLGFYPSFIRDSKGLIEMINRFPKEIISSMHINPDTIATIKGYYAYIFLYTTIALSIQGIILGLNVFSREYIDKTNDFLYTKPKSRARIVIEKILSVIGTVIITNIIATAVFYLMAKAISDGNFELRNFLVVSLSGLIIEFIFVALGLLIASVFRIKSVVPVAVSVVMSFFILSMLINLDGQSKYNFLTPFKFFDPSFIIANGYLELRYLLISIGFIIFGTVFSIIYFSNKDLKQEM